MNQPHLSTADLDAALHSTVLDGATAAHLNTCSTCAAELASLRLLFIDLRTSATAVAGHVRTATPSRSRSINARWFAWASPLAAAAALLFFVLPPHHTAAPPTAATPQLANPAADEKLLLDIQQDVSASVPDAMLPLASTSGKTSASTTGTTRSATND